MPYRGYIQHAKYKIKYTYSSRDDIRKIKKYILDHFKYRELSENFAQKIKEAIEGLKNLPNAYDTIEFQYKGFAIHLRYYRTYLFFYIVNEEDASVTILRVLQDRMNWQQIIKQWLMRNK